MSFATGSNPYCLDCEDRTHWVEIIVRDEHNKPFNNVNGVLIDASGLRYSVSVGDAPIIVTNLPPGRVTLELEGEEWLPDAQLRTHCEEDACPVERWMNENPIGFEGAQRQFHYQTLGDFVDLSKMSKIAYTSSSYRTPPRQQHPLVTYKPVSLPKRHNQGRLGTLNLTTDNSHVIKVQGCNYITLRIGMFFDGTGNNSYAAQWGQVELSKYYPQWLKTYTPGPVTALKDECFEWPFDDCGSAMNEYTNVQKLYDLYLDDELNKANQTFVHKQYVCGIGTDDVFQVQKVDESAFAAGAGRGKWGVIDKVNQGIEQLYDLGDSLSFINDTNPIDGLSKIEIDTFGFSRGAAASRHFINRVLDGRLGEYARVLTESVGDSGLKLIHGFDWDDNQYHIVKFAGLFDTVASIIGMGDWSGHNDVNDPVDLWLDPNRVERVVHLIADNTTEVRSNFSVNLINPATHFHEISLPGAHSDIGGGYHSELSMPEHNYLLPRLSKKLIANEVSETELTMFDSKKNKQRIQRLKLEIEKRVATAKLKDQRTGWLESEYCVEWDEKYLPSSANNAMIHRQKYQVSASLYHQTASGGELSRLYLRMMYGLAEHFGVPLHDSIDGNIVWEGIGKASKYYTVQDTLVGRSSNVDFAFGELNKEVLSAAKAGNFNVLHGCTKYKQELFDVGLIHHSMGLDPVTIGDFSLPIAPMEPHTIGSHFERVAHPVTK